MSSRHTKDLVKLIEKRAGDHNSADEAHVLIKQGADIKAVTKNGLMIDSVIAEANRHQNPSPEKARCCQQLIQVLIHQASSLLAASVLSSDGGSLNEITQLVGLNASCYQVDRFGPLGLLGELLKQDKVPIRLDVVEFLLSNDTHVRYALTKIDQQQQQTYLSLCQKNTKCPETVRRCLQKEFNMILNQSPFEQNHPVDINEIIQWIRRGANPEAVDEHRNTVLSNAVLSKNLELVRALVGVGCNIAHVNNENRTPLDIAKSATPRNAQLIAILEAQNINTELKQLIETKKSRLTVDEVNAVLGKGANINASIMNNSTPFHLLFANECTPEMIIAFVDEFNADIFAMDVNGYHPIETCILLDQSPCLNLQTFLNLSKVSTEMFFNKKLNKSILQFAQEQKRADAVKLIETALNLRLWNTVAKVNTNQTHNQSLLSDVNQLITYGAQINHQHTDQDYDQWTVLHLASKKSTQTFVQYLIDQFQANYLLTNANGDFLQSVAAEYGHLSIVQYLHILPNVKLNVSNREKQTPLHLATKNHHLLVVRYLILWGADYQAQNLQQQTAVDIARANASKNSTDQLTDKALIHFLEQLICPIKSDQEETQFKQADLNLDTCELVKSIKVDPIQVTSVGNEERLGLQSKGLFSSNANENLLNAAREGLVQQAKTAIGEGANICYRKNNRCAYDIVLQSIMEYNNQMISSQARLSEFQQYQQKLLGCQQIAEDIRQIAWTKLQLGIEQSQAYHVVAYHQAGSPLTGDLLRLCCRQSDNVQIVDYLIDQSRDVAGALFNGSPKDAPYYIAKKNQFHHVSTYLKYRLSVLCTEAIRTNDIQLVQKLIRAGASVDMHDTNNLQIALEHQNAELIQILCDHGAKLPTEWLQSETILLPTKIARRMNTTLVCHINRSLIHRRLRLAAANGDFSTLIQCQHLSADINSSNCYGSTALLCSIQHGNHFPIVHALVSRGATMLHSNENESMSLIALAEKRQSKAIVDYLSQELNVQFLTTILNNDKQNAEKFEALGANFNYQDEQKRTALHYAVQYHGIELVSWLCIRGSTPTIADIHDNYPISEAAEKGDYAVVELFAARYPATKQQKNKAGLTALQIAQKQGFKRIAYLLETGKSAPDTLEDSEAKIEGPKHTREQLAQAAKNGQLRIIKEFIDDRYDSRDEKRTLCYELIGLAKKAKQHEVIGILQPYYNKQLKAELPSDIEIGGSIKLNQYYKNILLGFLTGLGKIIAESSVVLDPADPNTYKELFSNVTTHQRKRLREIQNVDCERDVKRLSDEDMSNINDKLANINSELEKVNIEKSTLQQHMQETMEKLKKQENVTAMQRKDLFKQDEEHRKQLAVYECSIFLYELQQEATLMRKNTVKYIQGNPNMYLFFRTVENLLQALFHGALTARSGLLTTEKTTNAGTAAKIIDMAPTSFIPFSEFIVGAIKSTITTTLSKLDEKQQKKEYYNISTLGNIEELGRIASDTASLVTLYYQEQIQSIDVSCKIKGSNIFNHAVHWIKDVLIDVRPEEKSEMPVVVVAEYVTAWIMEALKAGKKELVLTEPFPQQLWLCVAKENCAKQNRTTAATDILGATAGQLEIPIKVKKGNDKVMTVRVQLRYLIGCVSVVTNDGQIYQYPVSEESSKKDITDLEIFGYVYVTPFLSDDQSFQSILDGRKLILAHRDDSHNILTKLKDIEQYVVSFQQQGNRTRQSAVTAETARQVARVLRDEKAFVDPKDVKTLLDKSRQDTEIILDDLREDIQQKTTYYQTSIDAASEKLENDMIQARQELKKTNEELHQLMLKNLTEQFKVLQVFLEKQIDQRISSVEKELKDKCDQMQKIVEAAKADSKRAVMQTTEAVQASQASAHEAEKAHEQAKKLAESIEQRRQEFQIVMEKCEGQVKQTIAEQKQLCEQTIATVRTKALQGVEQIKQSAELGATYAKESAQAAKDATKTAQDLQKDTKKQLDLQKEENNTIMLSSKEVTRQNEKSASAASEASKQARTGAETLTVGMRKIDYMYEKMEKAIERSERLARRFESKQSEQT